MKKYIYLIGVTLLAVMTACTNEDLVPQTEALKLTEGELIEKISFTTPDLEVDDASTRGFYKEANGNMTFYWSTYADALLKADTIGVFPIRGNERADQIFFPVAETTNSNTAFFDGLGWGLRTGYTYGAYYPYDFNNRNCREIKVDYTGQRLLTNNSIVLLSRHDFMVSNQIKPTTNELSIPLKRLGAIVKVELDFNDYITNLGSQAPEKIIFVEDFTLGTTENVFALHGKVSLADETPAFQPEDEELRSSSVSVALGDPNLTEQTFWTNKNNHNWKVTMFMTLPPTELAGKTLTATLKDKDGNKYVAQFDGKNLVAGKAYSFNGSMKIAKEMGFDVITNPNIIEAIGKIDFEGEGYWAPERTDEGYLIWNNEWVLGVKELNLNGKHDPTIADELHYFTSLQRLSVDYNEIERLDLSYMEELQELSCNWNNLKELILPNNCEFLTRIDAIDNQLTSLDLSGCSNLAYLALGSNQLSYIDLSMCSSLWYLHLAENQLTSIDLKDNGQLQSLNLMYNQLSKIDVSNNTSLTDLRVSANKLKEIDVSNNTSLTDLRVSDNKLKEIDVTNLTELTSLSVGYNQLTSIDLSHNSKLTDLEISSNKISSIDTDQLPNLESFYADNTLLTSVLFSNRNALKAVSVRGSTSLIVLGISGCPNLEGLVFNGCTSLERLNVTDSNLRFLNLVGLTSLKSVLLRGNQLSSLLVNYHPVLEYICCSENHLGSLVLANPGLGLWNLSGEDLGTALLLGGQTNMNDGTPQTVDVRIPSSMLDKVKSAVEEFNPGLNTNVNFIGV